MPSERSAVYVSVTKCFFILSYSASCLSEASVRPEKYWLVCVGLQANHLFNLNFIFLSDGLMAVAE
jgi:hypothetical protein